MFTVLAVKALLVLFHVSTGKAQTLLRGSADSERCDTRTNVEDEMLFIRKQLIHLNNEMTGIKRMVSNEVRERKDEGIQLKKQMANLETGVNEQTVHQKIIERNLNSTTEKIADFTSMISAVKTTVDRLIAIVPTQDCHTLLSSNQTLADGVYTIKPAGSATGIQVFCEMGNGGWTVFQRRQDGSQDFYLGWAQYRDGFGDPEKEYWLGNQHLHLLTLVRNCTLRIDLTNRDNITRYAEYENFRIDNEVGGFALHIGKYTGNAGFDALAYSNGYNFTTRDRDQDMWPGGNCAVGWSGAWWYGACTNSNLNGYYTARDHRGVWWKYFPSSYNMKHSVMKIKCS